MAQISVVIPLYKCEECIDELYERLLKTLSTITLDYEIIFVNDGSPQGDWNKIKKISESDKKVKSICLFRNFGQHYAITAGIDISRGEYTVVMDGDLQDQPEEIIKLYNKVLQGHDVVFARRVHRQDKYFKKMCSIFFYLCLSYFTDTEYDPSIANFSISRKAVIDNFKLIREQNRLFPVFIRWIVGKFETVEVVHSQRYSGISSYTFGKLINLALDIIISQSNKPLKLFIKFGFLMSLASLVYSLYLIYFYMVHLVPVEGWTSLMVSIYFISGIGFSSLGILGLYVGKIFDETKQRPLYLVKSRINFQGDSDEDYTK